MLSDDDNARPRAGLGEDLAGLAAAARAGLPGGPIPGEAERTARSVLDALSSCVAVVDEAGTVVAANRAWREFDGAGAPLTALEGANYFQACAAAEGEGSADAGGFAADVRAVLNGGPGGPARELRCVGPEGDRWFAGTVQPFAGSGPPRALVVLEDVSDRKAVEQSHRESGSLFAQMFRHSPLGLALARIEPVGRFVTVNPSFCRMLGFTEEELLSGCCHTVSEEGLVEQERAYFRALVAHEIPFYRMEKRYLHKSGESIWGRLHVTLIDDESGTPAYLLGMVEDVSERKRAEEALTRAAERTESLSRRLFRAQEDERRRIARELHDELGQALTALRFHIQAGDDALPGAPGCGPSEGLAIVDECLRQVRGMALDLRPSVLDDLGLLAALQWYASRYAERTGLRGAVVAESAEVRADPEVETACFRVAQEALTNVARHARATRFGVEVSQDAGGLRLVVRDDGCGFDVGAAFRAGARGTSFGLVGMRERVELIGGRLAVASGPGGGTEVRVEFPATPGGGGRHD